MLTFQINLMLVSQIHDIISHFGLDWDPLAGPIDIYNIHSEQQSVRNNSAYFIIISGKVLKKFIHNYSLLMLTID